MWSLLVDELDNWSRTDSVATFWWRDDDAVSDTKELDVLLDCARRTPLALAVIPDVADRSLARKIARFPSVTVLQHGWRHANHASAGDASEYPAGREPSEVAREFSRGRQILSELFGAQSLPVFAPPWHGFDVGYLPLLSQCGISGISRKGARNDALVSGLFASNVHCVPIRWTTPPSFGSDENCLRVILDHLEGRRRGRYDASEPTGVLTHHLVQDARSYAFMARLVEFVSEHSAAQWLDAREIFQQRGRNVANPGFPDLV